MILDGTSCGVLPLDVNLGQNFKTNPNAPSMFVVYIVIYFIIKEFYYNSNICVPPLI